MVKPYRQWARYLRWILAAGLVVALAAGYVKYLDFFYHWGHSHSTGVIHARSWLIASIAVLSAVALVMLAELIVLALPVAKGLVNERRGRSARAAECYKRALSCYLRGGYLPFRNASRMAGVVLFRWKFEALDQTPDEAFATLKDLQSAVDHLQRGPYRLLMGKTLSQGFGEVSNYIGTVEGMSEVEDIAREGGLARLEERAAESGSDDLNRGMTLYELGHYQRARASFDQATDAYKRSGDTDMAEIPRLFGALAAWECGDQDDCERRLRGWQPADLDLRLWALGLKCLLASAQRKTGKALAILERTAARVPDGSADASALAWLATVRATVLRAAGRYDDALSYARQAVDHFQQAGPTLALDSRLEVARALIGLGRHDEAVAVAARATAELDALRYQLDFTENRFAFARGQGAARALALELASASAPRLTAELVEGARVQGLPTPREDHSPIDAGQVDHRNRRSRPWGRASSSEPPSAEQNAQPAGWTAVGLASLGPARRLDLFVAGDSELGRLAPDLEPAGRVVLAQVAEAVAGREWWWWGSWAAGAQLYWSLLGHAGTVEAGAIPMASLEPVLTRLLEALPTRLAGETGGNAARAQAGALARPGTALDLLSELGALLIPPTLRHLALARAASGQPLSLVVAPASPLGRVPFGLLGLGKPGTHLAHGAIIQLGLPAALLEQVRLRQPAPCNGQVLSVIDPCGRKEEPPDKQMAEPAEDKTLSLVGRGQLHQMGITRWAWLQHSPVLSRTGHLDELATITDQAKQATISELNKALRTTSAGVLAYIGHVRHGSDDAPANASLVLDDDDLLARDLLYPGKHRWPVPPRVALLGCGSGGAQAPEWLGLAPAAVWAGAEVVAATAWDLIGEAETWRLADEVVSILAESPDPAAEWQQRMIDHLAAWTTHVGAPSPLSWGAIQFTGIGHTGPSLPS
jgi:tetratricopeptide (TPR) repeat protein